jgi:hypothetical protein
MIASSRGQPFLRSHPIFKKPEKVPFVAFVDQLLKSFAPDLPKGNKAGPSQMIVGKLLEQRPGQGSFQIKKLRRKIDFVDQNVRSVMLTAERDKIKNIPFSVDDKISSIALDILGVIGFLNLK